MLTGTVNSTGNSVHMGVAHNCVSPGKKLIHKNPVQPSFISLVTFQMPFLPVMHAPTDTVNSMGDCMHRGDYFTYISVLSGCTAV